MTSFLDEATALEALEALRTCAQHLKVNYARKQFRQYDREDSNYARGYVRDDFRVVNSPLSKPSKQGENRQLSDSNSFNNNNKTPDLPPQKKNSKQSIGKVDQTGAEPKTPTPRKNKNRGKNPKGSTPSGRQIIDSSTEQGDLCEEPSSMLVTSNSSPQKRSLNSRNARKDQTISTNTKEAPSAARPSAGTTDQEITKRKDSCETNAKPKGRKPGNSKANGHETNLQVTGSTNSSVDGVVDGFPIERPQTIFHDDPKISVNEDLSATIKKAGRVLNTVGIASPTHSLQQDHKSRTEISLRNGSLHGQDGDQATQATHLANVVAERDSDPVKIGGDDHSAAIHDLISSSRTLRDSNGHAMLRSDSEPLRNINEPVTPRSQSDPRELDREPPYPHPLFPRGDGDVQGGPGASLATIHKPQNIGIHSIPEPPLAPETQSRSNSSTASPRTATERENKTADLIVKLPLASESPGNENPTESTSKPTNTMVESTAKLSQNQPSGKPGTTSMGKRMIYPATPDLQRKASNKQPGPSSQDQRLSAGSAGGSINLHGAQKSHDTGQRTASLASGPNPSSSDPKKATLPSSTVVPSKAHDKPLGSDRTLSGARKVNNSTHLDTTSMSAVTSLVQESSPLTSTHKKKKKHFPSNSEASQEGSDKAVSVSGMHSESARSPLESKGMNLEKKVDNPDTSPMSGKLVATTSTQQSSPPVFTHKKKKSRFPSNPEVSKEWPEQITSGSGPSSMAQSPSEAKGKDFEERATAQQQEVEAKSTLHSATSPTMSEGSSKAKGKEKAAVQAPEEALEPTVSPEENSPQKSLQPTVEVADGGDAKIEEAIKTRSSVEANRVSADDQAKENTSQSPDSRIIEQSQDAQASPDQNSALLPDDGQGSSMTEDQSNAKKKARKRRKKKSKDETNDGKLIQIVKAREMEAAEALVVMSIDPFQISE